MGLDSVELILAIEDSFRVSIPDAQIANMQRVGDIHAWLCCHTPDDSLEIWERLRTIVAEHVDVPVGAVRPESHLVEDFRLD